MATSSSYHIETGAVTTNTKVDGVIAVRFVEQGVILDSEDGLAAFLPYGAFRYIKNLGPASSTGKSLGPAVTLTGSVFADTQKCRCR